MGWIEVAPDTAISEKFGELEYVIVPVDKEWFATGHLDFKDGLEGSGFEWANGAATGCCGCAKSFSCAK